MSKHRRRSWRATAVRPGVLALCAFIALTAWTLWPAHQPGRRASPFPSAQALAAPRTPAAAPIIGAGSATLASDPVPLPVGLRIPKIGVHTPLQRLGLKADGSMQPPSAWAVAGWYDGGPRPGQVGPAVIVGHIDSTSGPAVFYHLSEVRVGDNVFVTERGGGVLRFVVDDIETFAKSHFPTWRVYGPQPMPVLRLITCTGAFDPAARSYVDNLVVSAHLATATDQPG